MQSSPEYTKQYFPRGLAQPEGSFRFSIDALLLSCFATAKPGQRLLDIGTGCGVIALAMLLRCPQSTAVGLDIEPALLSSALVNAKKLGLEQCFEVLQQDVEHVLQKIEQKNKEANLNPPALSLQAESFDLAVCNPPYRRSNQGRLPEHPLRLRALFEDEKQGRLEAFVASAAFALKNKASFYCVYPAERLSSLLTCLKQYKLEPKILLPLQSRQNTDCSLILLKATKNGRPGLTLKNPLLLYESNVTSDASANSLSGQALDFCPWLACNADR